MSYMPNDPNAPVLELVESYDEDTGFAYITPDQLLWALAHRLFPAIASGEAYIYDNAALIDGWKVALVDTDHESWDAYREDLDGYAQE